MNENDNERERETGTETERGTNHLGMLYTENVRRELTNTKTITTTSINK